MALDNLITQELTAEEVTSIGQALDTIIGIMERKAVNLTTAERRQYGNVADYNKIFIDKVKTIMEQTPSTVPPTVNKTEFDRDYKLSQQLAEPIRKVNRIAEMFSDTKRIADYDAYSTALAYYQYIKFLSTQNSAGTTAIYSELKKHFKKAGKAQEDEKESQTEA